MFMVREQLCFRLDFFLNYFSLYLGSHFILEFSERSFVCYLWLCNIWGSSVGFKWKKARKKQNPEFVHNDDSFFYMD